jgi:hypothetical protein
MSDPSSAASAGRIFVNRNQRPGGPCLGWQKHSRSERKTRNAPGEVKISDHFWNPRFGQKLNRSCLLFASQMGVLDVRFGSLADILRYGAHGIYLVVIEFRSEIGELM